MMKPMSRNSYRRTSDLSLRTDYQMAKAAMEDKNSVAAFITCSHQLTELHHVEFVRITSISSDMVLSIILAYIWVVVMSL